MESIVILTLLLISVIGFLTGYRLTSHPYPPGPPGLPVLGVALKHPKQEFWKTYAEWGRQYGPKGIISFHVLGRRLVVINSAKVANDLLDKRGVNYSDRPFPTMAGVLMKREKSMFYIPYNARLKHYRRLMQKSFNTSAARSYWSIQEHEAHVVLAKIIQSPDQLVRHLRRYSAAVIMKIGFGYTVADHDDHFVALAEEGMRVGSLAGAPGKWLVDSLPFLRFLPDWAPGAGFKRLAKEWGHALYIQSLEPHNYVKAQLVNGTAQPSFTADLLREIDNQDMSPEEYDDIVLWTAGALYSAGADTTVSVITTFFFVMLLYPEVQARAQKEVDELMEREQRLPKLEDRKSLPYLEAILTEVIRWHPPAPIGLLHATVQDDIYENYFIPAKTTIIANIWAMLHDPEIYPDPFIFNPDRFLGSAQQADIRNIIFGFGYRRCPGNYIGEDSLFIEMAIALACVSISPPKDDKGRDSLPEIGFTTAIVSHVKPFKYVVTPRPFGADLLQQTLLGKA